MVEIALRQIALRLKAEVPVLAMGLGSGILAACVIDSVTLLTLLIKGELFGK